MVTFFDTNIIDTLLPINTFKPNRIVMLIAPEDLNSSASVNLEEAIHHLYDAKYPVKFSFMQSDDNSASVTRNRLEQILETNPGEEIIINLSSANEIITIASITFADKFPNVTPIFIDKKINNIHNALYPDEAIKDIKYIDLDTFMIALGARGIGSSHHLPNKDEFDSIINVAEYLFSHIMSWHALCDFLSKTTTRLRIDEPFPIHNMINYNGRSYSMKKILKIFIDNGYLEHMKDNLYTYPNNKSKEYMTTYGIWLELYTYIKAQELFEDVRLGYKIDWIASDEDETVDNEVDVVAIYGSLPCFISCKMTDPTLQDLNEIGNIANHLRGVDAHPILVTTSRIREDDNLRKKLYSKFANLNIGLIEVQDFKNSDAKSLFLTALTR